MISATLGIRGNESWDWYADPPLSAPNLFAIQLMEVKFPPGKSSDRQFPFTVPSMQWAVWGDDAEASWGWVLLDQDLKVALADELREMEAFGRWVYLVIDVGEMVTFQ